MMATAKDNRRTHAIMDDYKEQVSLIETWIGEASEIPQMIDTRRDMVLIRNLLNLDNT